jgi:hypothetical protein
MARLICGCLVWLLALSVIPAEAARQKPVVRPASAQDTFKKGTSTLDIERHWGEVIDVQGGRVNLPVTQASKYNFTRLAGLLKQAINANPVKYAATAGVTYLITQLPGASFDPLTGEILRTPAINTSLVYWSPGFGNNGDTRFAAAISACQQGISTRYVTKNGSTQPLDGSESVAGCRSNVTGEYIGPVYRTTTTCPNGATGLYCNSDPQAPQPFTSSDYDALVANTPGIPESAWPDLHDMLTGDIPGSFDGPDLEDFSGPSSVQGDPIHTTTLDQVTGNTTVSETIPTHNFSYSPNPLSITSTTTTTTNNYQNGTLVSTTTVTESPTVGEVQPLPEIPTDCDFMPTVCDFIDWVREPFNEEEPDLSELITDEDFERDFNFSSNASCPAPLQIATSRDTYEFSFEPACEWAGMIKPFFLIAALITAIYLNLGVFRGGH